MLSPKGPLRGEYRSGADVLADAPSVPRIAGDVIRSFGAGHRQSGTFLHPTGPAQLPNLAGPLLCIHAAAVQVPSACRCGSSGWASAHPSTIGRLGSRSRSFYPPNVPVGPQGPPGAFGQNRCARTAATHWAHCRHRSRLGDRPYLGRGWSVAPLSAPALHATPDGQISIYAGHSLGAG